MQNGKLNVMESLENVNDEATVTFTNYHNKIHSTFYEMFRNKELCDAILICNHSQYIFVHKFLLSASSSFFNQMFQTQSSHEYMKYGHVLPFVTFDNMMIVLEYIYRGQVTLTSSKVPEFVLAANTLGIKIHGENIATFQNTKITENIEYTENAQKTKHIDIDAASGKLVLHVSNIGV